MIRSGKRVKFNPRVKDEAYYAKKLEEARPKTKDFSLVAKGGSESDGM